MKLFGKTKKIKKIIPHRNPITMKGDILEMNEISKTKIFIDKSKDYDAIVTTCVLGAGSVGKTSMILSLDDTTHQHNMTIFDNFEMTFNVGQLRVCNVIYDTAGQAIYDEFSHMAAKKSDIILLCFDVSNPDSLMDAKRIFIKIIQIFQDLNKTKKNSGLSKTVNDSKISPNRKNDTQRRNDTLARSINKAGTIFKRSKSDVIEYHAQLPMMFLICNKIDLYDENDPTCLTKKKIMEVKNDMEKLMQNCGLNPFTQKLKLFAVSAFKTPRRARCAFILPVTNYIQACNGQKLSKIKLLSSFSQEGEDLL